jgi:hypothetical protein
MKTKLFLRICIMMLASTFNRGVLEAQTMTTASDKFVINGIAADEKGPIANLTIIVMPVSKTLGPVIRYKGTDKNGILLAVDASCGTERTLNEKTSKWTFKYKIGDSSVSGPRLNPEAKTDADGTFSVTVPQSLFKDYTTGTNVITKYKVGEIGLGVFSGSVSSYEMEIIKYDVNASKFDIGKLVFKSAREPEK